MQRQQPQRLLISFCIPEDAQIGLIQRLVEAGATDLDFGVELKMPHTKNQPRQLPNPNQLLLPGPKQRKKSQQPTHPAHKKRRKQRGLRGSRTPTLLMKLRDKYQRGTFYKAELKQTFTESGLAVKGFDNWIHRAVKSTKIIKRVKDKYALNVDFDALAELGERQS